MKKALRGNISGLIFHIDEDAFNKLKNYLDSIKNKFVDIEEGKEIIADVEARIAEIFQSKVDAEAKDAKGCREEVQTDQERQDKEVEGL